MFHDLHQSVYLTLSAMTISSSSCPIVPVARLQMSLLMHWAGSTLATRAKAAERSAEEEEEARAEAAEEGLTARRVRSLRIWRAN